MLSRDSSSATLIIHRFLRSGTHFGSVRRSRRRFGRRRFFPAAFGIAAAQQKTSAQKKRKNFTLHEHSPDRAKPRAPRFFFQYIGKKAKCQRFGKICNQFVINGGFRNQFVIVLLPFCNNSAERKYTKIPLPHGSGICFGMMQKYEIIASRLIRHFTRLCLI